MSKRGISKRVLALVVGTAALAAVATLVSRGVAGPDKIAFPAKYKDGVLYTIADRYDVKQYRELYASAAAVQAAKEGKPLPSGTVLTLIQYKAQVDAQGNPVKDAKGRFMKGDLIAYAVMEKRTGWGAEYPEDIRNGEWEYAVFTADGKFNEKANYKACFQCHKPHDQMDFVISYPAMAGRTMVASAAPAPAGSIGVNIGAFTFGPPGITINPGKTVTWTNTDESPHQITVAGTPLKTGLLLKGQNASLTFKDEGVFSYNCALHPNMKGSVQVSK
jgi:plastocyanin